MNISMAALRMIVFNCNVAYGKVLLNGDSIQEAEILSRFELTKSLKEQCVDVSSERLREIAARKP